MTDALASAAASEQGRDFRADSMFGEGFSAGRNALCQDGRGASELECSSAAPKRAANDAVLDSDDWGFLDVEDGRGQLNTHVLPSLQAEASGSSDCGPWRELESFSNICWRVKDASVLNVVSRRLTEDTRSNATSPCNTRASGVGR